MNKKIHIVCLDAPAPPDYGGAIDMYYKIVALAQKGFEIILHYFNYKPDRDAGPLKNYCKEIYTYQRSNILKTLLTGKPYIIASRINKKLIERLNNDDAPVLLEGIHCTGIIPFLKNKSRKLVVRVHNDEAVYYNNLARSAKSLFKKLYFSVEAALLNSYQKKLSAQANYAFVSTTDSELFENKYGLKKACFIPCFTAWQQINIKEGFGKYCLYHGNLAVAENNKAAIWLIENVFAKLTIPFVIAGRQPSKTLMELAGKYDHIQLVANPDNSAMEQLIQEAHIHVLPSFNNTGVKLKLLHVMASGRFCITNKAGIAGSGLNEMHVTEMAEDFAEQIKQLMPQPFTANDIEKRKLQMQLYNNEANAEKLSALLR